MKLYVCVQVCELNISSQSQSAEMSAVQDEVQTKCLKCQSLNDNVTLLQNQCDEYKTQADQYKSEADQNRTEADQYKTQADQYKSEADQNRTEADQYKTCLLYTSDAADE